MSMVLGTRGAPSAGSVLTSIDEFRRDPRSSRCGGALLSSLMPRSPAQCPAPHFTLPRTLLPDASLLSLVPYSPSPSSPTWRHPLFDPMPHTLAQRPTSWLPLLGALILSVVADGLPIPALVPYRFGVPIGF